jgi:hypothetical protein
MMFTSPVPTQTCEPEFTPTHLRSPDDQPISLFRRILSFASRVFRDPLTSTMLTAECWLRTPDR